MVYEDAERDYIAGMKYKDIAEKYNVTLNTVKSWKTRYQWIRGPGDNGKKSEKVCAHKTESVCTQKTGADDKQAAGEDGLTDRQRLFAVYFVKKHNATKAYMKAYGCGYDTAAVNASKTLRIPKVKEFVDNLRENQLKSVMIREEDILQKYVDIAYADPLDYVDRKTGLLREDVEDASLLELIPADGGVIPKFPDRMKALKELQGYFKEKNNLEQEESYSGVVIIPERMHEDDMETTT